MPMVTPTLNLPQPTPPAAPVKAAASVAPSSSTLAVGAPAPSATVTLSPQAQSAMAASHAAAASTNGAAGTPQPAPSADDGSVYEAIKNGIATAVADVGDAISGGAHAIVEGVETTLSTLNKAATGIVELPFAVVSKACDAAGALIDEF